MILTITLLFFATAAPKDCQEDFECLVKALKTCGPATYRDSTLHSFGFDRAFGVVPKGFRLYTLQPGKAGACRLECETRVESVEIADKALDFIVSRTDGGMTREQVRAKLESQALQGENPNQHIACAMAPSKIETVLKGLRQGSYSSADWQDCKSLSCFGLEWFPQPASGCAWSRCREGARALSCSAAGKTLTCRPESQVATPVDASGKQVCTARCKKAHGEVELDCPK